MSSNKRKNCETLSNFVKRSRCSSLPAPTVVHLRRSKGQIVQNCDVYIGRACQMGGWKLTSSKWQNPFSVKEFGRDEALERYRKYVESNEKNLLDDLHELSGKRLGCWCKPLRCHGDILCELFRKKFSNCSSTLTSKVEKLTNQNEEFVEDEESTKCNARQQSD